MTSGAPGRLTLFVAGEPKTVPTVRETNVGLYPRIAGVVIGSAAVAPGPATQPTVTTAPPLRSDEAPPEEAPEWYIPPDQMTALNLVLQIAQERRQAVLVVDANRPEDQQGLVDQYVGENDVLPLLIRGDGARLDGGENFTPSKLRAFLAGR